MPLNVKCKRCANLKHGWCALKIDSPDPDIVRDCERFRTRTNHDNLLDMSREELAWFYAQKIASCYGCESSTMEDCAKCWLDWLKSPEEVEE